MKKYLQILQLLVLTFLMFWTNDILAQEPTTPSSNLSFSNIDGNRLRLQFNSGNGANRLIIAKEGSPVTAVPSDGVDYVDGGFGDGNEIAPGEFVVYEGSSSFPYVYELDHSTTYHFRIYEFNGSNTETDYLTSSFLEGSQATLTNPTTQASNITFSNVSGTSMTVNWVNGDGDGRILIAKEGSPVDVEPQQLVNYSSSSSFGSSWTEIGTDNYVLYRGSGSSDNVSNLQPGVTYHFAVFEYNGSSGKVYLTSTSSPSIAGTTNSQTTSTFPTVNATLMQFDIIDGNRIRIDNFPSTYGNGANKLIVAKEGGPVTGSPVNGTAYNADNDFGDGDTLGAGEFVVFNGTNPGAQYVRNLQPNTTYHFKVFEYNGSGTNTFYLTGLDENNDPVFETSQSTLSNPTTQASNITFSNVEGTSMTVNWDNGDGDGRILIAKEGSPVDVEPQQLIDYSSSSSFGSSWTEIGTDNYVLYRGSGSSDNVSNLEPGLTYHFAVFEYNGSNGKLYLTSTSTPNSAAGATNSQTTEAFPTVNTTLMQFDIIDGNRIRIDNFPSTYGNGANKLIVAKEGGPVTGSPVNGTAYNADNDFGDGDTLGAGEYVVYNGTNPGSQYVRNLQPNTTYHFKVFEYNGSGTNTFYLTGLDENNDPVFETSQSTLSNPTTQASNITFSNVEGTSMTVNWDNGNGDRRILIAREGSPVPVDAEPQQLTNYSDSSGGFGSSFYEIGTGNYVLYDGSGSSDNITNLQPGMTYHFALFEYNGSSGKLYLTSSSTPNSAAGATNSQTTEAFPTVNATLMQFDIIDGNRIRIDNSPSTYGNGANKLIVAKEGGPVTGSPINGTAYNADNDFGDGDTLGAGEFVVYNGTNPGSQYVRNLQPNTTYHFKVFEYNGSGTNTFYLTGLDENNDPVYETSQATLSAPTTNSAGVFFNSKTSTSFNLNWTNGNGSGRLLIVREGDAVDVEPQDLVEYSNSSGGFGSSFYEIGTGNYAIYDSSGNSVNVTNLNPGTNYHFELFEYNGSSGKVYLRPGYTFEEQTFGTTPTIQVSNPLFSVVTSSSMLVDFDKGDGSHRLVLAKKGNPVNATPQDLSSYNASNLFGNGDEIGTGNFVVFNDTGEQFQMTNLDPSSTYHFAFFEYSISASGELYLTPGLTASQTTASLPCQVPTNLSANSITNNSATLIWDLETTATAGFDYVLNTDGTVPDSDTTPTGSVGSSTNTIDLDSLSPNTEYFFFIRSDCEFNQSQWSNFVTFTTLCDDPVAVTQDITVQLDANGQVSITPSQVDDDSIANCGSSNLSLDITDFDCSDIGPNTVTLTVTDINDNTASATAVVTVEDSTAPTVLTQNISVQLDSNGQATITPEDINNGSTDNCGIDTLSLNTTTFDCSNVGANNVILTVTDVNGNSNSNNATVTVEDINPPTVVTQDITVQLGAGGTVTIEPSQIDDGSTDDCGIDNLSLDISTFDINDVGANTVALTVTDQGGNSASDTAVVTVQNTDLPIVITQDITVSLDINGEVSIVPSDIDNGSTSSGSTSLSIDISEFNCSNVGPNTVTLTVSDGLGNSETGTAIVTVEDILLPTAITQDLTVEIDENGQGTLAATMVDNGSSDNCGIANVSIDKSSFSCSDIGINIVTLTVTDVNGNSSTATANITVEDQNPPNVRYAYNDMD